MNNFDFSKEMILGKKHNKLLNYNNDNYDFRKYARDCFNIKKLEEVHINNPKYEKFTEFKKDVQTWYHKKFYTYLDSEKGNDMKVLYDKLIKEVILPYLNLSEALVQKFPSFRVQLPENVAVAKKHNDNSLGHPIGEINFTYTFTDMKDSTAILIEKMPRMNDYIKIEAEENNIVSFNANLCVHYNEVNTTGKTRMSMDFRILPLNYKPQDDGFSHTSNKKFVDGGYYKLVKIN
tara:strand:- start:4950 stop:5651 length:702 start_codon:yes stop_codon:yes gene_type:complete